ncbi:MAG: hypothetical protein FWH44_05555 [Methanomassiliicoccaceae archaeon]|nr:hypothetical protein [Methanomassiliicoccaceae archaeon]
MSENRIDPTVAGLFLVAFITLVFGLFGIEMGGDLSWGVPAATLAPVVGLMFVVFTVSAIRFGNAFAAALFGFVAISLIAVPMIAMVSPFVFYLIFAMYVVFAIVALLIGAPKLLFILLLLVGLIFLFVGVSSSDAVSDMTWYLAGVFGILAGVVALYMAFGLSTQKLPVF